MEISISSLVAQMINFGIMILIFSKFVAKPISNAIEERRSLIEKIKNADEFYKEKIEEAEQKVELMVLEGVKKRELLISEGESLALKRQIEIINEANEKGQKIQQDAQNAAKTLESNLENVFIDSVKTTSRAVVKKLLQRDITLQKEYLDEIVKNSV